LKVPVITQVIMFASCTTKLLQPEHHINKIITENRLQTKQLTRNRGVTAKVRSTSSRRLTTGSFTTAGYGRLYKKQHIQQYLHQLTDPTAVTSCCLQNFHVIEL